MKIEDNGVGLSAASKDEKGGRGLALHSTMMAVVGGALLVERGRDGGARIVLKLPKSWKVSN